MPPFRLQGLPRELRDQIYNNLFKSDKLNMLRTCRSIHMEVDPMLYKEVIFSIAVPGGRYHKAAPFTEPHLRNIKHKIQNLDVCWDLREDHRPHAYHITTFQSDASTNRKRCRVFCGWDPPPAPLFLRDDHLSALKTLVGFEWIEFYLRSNSDKSHDPNEGPQCRRPLYETLRERFEPTFGAARLYGNEDGKSHRLVFHSRGH